MLAGAGVIELAGALLEPGGALLELGGALLELGGAELAGALLDDAGALLEAADDEGRQLTTHCCFDTGELVSFLPEQVTVMALPPDRVRDLVAAAATDVETATVTTVTTTNLVRAHRARLACFGRAARRPAPRRTRLIEPLLQRRMGGEARPANEPSGAAHVLRERTNI